MISIRRNNFRLAYRSVKAAKARSFLTMLGIIIGVMAVVLVICIGQGVKQQVAGQLGHYGKSVFAVQPSAPTGSNNVLAGLSGVSSLLTNKDFKTVQKTDGVQYAIPLSTTTGSMTGDHTVTTPYIVATTADFPNIIDQSMASGGFFDPEDGSKTVVLGSSIAQRLFDDNAPLGQALTWRGQRFIVAGVFNDFVAPPLSLESNFNNAVFVPYSTAQSLTGSVLGIYQVLAKATSERQAPQVMHRVSAALAAAHGGAHDVQVATAAAASTSAQTLHLLTLLIAGAAVISLVVGGVGIMDVMLVSITERMHEIGIRKAIGATNGQIMRQFVAEAFVLSGLGALIGVALSCAAVGLLRLYTSLQAVLVWQALVIAPLLAVLTGLFFGSMPALKAARKDPIDALRQG